MVRALTRSSLFHAHTTNLATEASLLPDHVFGTLEQPPITFVRRIH